MTRRYKKVIWMRLKHEDTGQEITITFDESDDCIYVPDAPWLLADSKLIQLWT